jgi:hypothetical protein
MGVKKLVKMHNYTYQASWKEACAMADKEADFKAVLIDCLLFWQCVCLCEDLVVLYYAHRGGKTHMHLRQPPQMHTYRIPKIDACRLNPHTTLFPFRFSKPHIPMCLRRRDHISMHMRFRATSFNATSVTHGAAGLETLHA